MISEIATIDIINTALSQIEDGRVNDAKQVLTTYKDKLQNEVNQFDKWAETQSNIDTSIQLEVDKALGK
tara:strand:- start:32 stop:238 length:207 start_codon:yes stop_codon:yes gene_type:complete